MDSNSGTSQVIDIILRKAEGHELRWQSQSMECCRRELQKLDWCNWNWLDKFKFKNVLVDQKNHWADIVVLLKSSKVSMVHQSILVARGHCYYFSIPQIFVVKKFLQQLFVFFSLLKVPQAARMTNSEYRSFSTNVESKEKGITMVSTSVWYQNRCDTWS